MCESVLYPWYCSYTTHPPVHLLDSESVPCGVLWKVRPGRETIITSYGPFLLFFVNSPVLCVRDGSQWVTEVSLVDRGGRYTHRCPTEFGKRDTETSNRSEPVDGPESWVSRVDRDLGPDQSEKSGEGKGPKCTVTQEAWTWKILSEIFRV